MIIRKLFRFEGAHIVRNCTSVRCRENIHGHSYVVEVFVESDVLDRGYMVMDFALMSRIKEFIDGFDHSYSLWRGEPGEFKDFVRKYNRRVVEIPLSPSAEGYALMFLYVLDKIVGGMKFRNGEGQVCVSSVRVHETATGYAEAFRADLALVDFALADFDFSPDITSEWEGDWWKDLCVEQ